ncbi:MAG: hypothetical protein HeimC3_28680 [Candidatus Heimdallarchaeota archaeon LC_3]|nr:MAG: hypothetical protein HeimC3_28680 [Candidatus Heimdallarchaeota archaeon LC_3]
MTSFKEKFDKWELLATPIITFVVLILILTFSQGFLGSDESLNLFIFPLIIGLVIGIVGFSMLEKLWIQVNQETMSKFLRLPTFVLGIIAVLAVMLSNFDIISINESLILLMIGMGIVVGIINIASIITFYRVYYKKAGS